MPIDPRTAALTVINEAISAFQYEPLEQLETDDLTMEAIDALMAARERLTSTPWPEFPPRYLDVEAFEAWHTTKSAEQRLDGRQ